MTVTTRTEHVDAHRLEAARRNAALRPSATQAETARRLQAHTHRRWLCWYGHSTGRYWAIPTGQGPFRLIEAATPQDLTIAMGEADAYHGGRS